MNTSQFKLKSRREFVKDCLRFGAGGGLIVIGAILGFRDDNPEDRAGDCTLKNPCRGCSKYTGCNLPRAQNAKKTNDTI
jgi:hypothetical protein